MRMILKQFDALTREQILAFGPGRWSDRELLDAVEYLETEKKDRQRAAAVAELILRSPQVVEVDYYALYLNLLGYYRWQHNYPAALRWAHACLAFDEQHQPGLNRLGHTRDLAEIYLEAGDLNTGLALFTRLAQASPANLWNYNALGFALPRAGLPGLALEVLDYALALIARHDPEHLKDQLTNQRRLVAETLAATPADGASALAPAGLAEFRAALLPAKPTRVVTRDDAIPYLPPLTHLLATGPAGDPALESEIRTQGKALIPELLRLAFDEDLPVAGAPARAVALLREWREAQVAELGELSAWLEQASADWRSELLSPHCGKIGGYTTSELEAIAADTRYSFYVRASASESLAERARRLPAQRAGVVDIMRRLLTRPEAYAASEEAFMGFLIGDALDLDAHELYPKIQRAFEEDRVDPLMISPLDMQDRLGPLPQPLPPKRKDGLYLMLCCTACDRVREHFVQTVLLDVATLERQAEEDPASYDPYIMDHEIVCPKCGAVDRYAMTPTAHLALTVISKTSKDLAALLSGKKSLADFPPNPRLHPFRSSVFGQPMHPLAGLEEYRRRIAAQPQDAKLYMKMGTLLRTLRRHSAALEAHRQAYALDANNAEIALVRGLSEHDFGDQAAAKEMYERVLTLELKGQGARHILSTDTWAGAAAEGLDLLKRRRPSAWAVPSYDPQTGQKAKAEVSSPAEPKPKRRRHR